MREVMDCLNDPRVERVVGMCCRQVAKTDVLMNVLGYFVDYDPSPILLIQPVKELAQAFSKDRLAPTIRDTPVLRAKIKETKSRDPDNAMLHKAFPGGTLTLAGANSTAGMIARSVRVLLFDEIDQYPKDLAGQGDAIDIAIHMADTFWNRKILMMSTPTVKGESRIEKAYEGSSKGHWCLPCPACGEHQPMTWAQFVFEDQEGKPGHTCFTCGVISGELEWKAGAGKWIHEDPDNPIRGFHMNAFCSPWMTWPAIIAKFKMANEDGREAQKTFSNTVLGEVWEEGGESAEEDALASRRHYYNCDVPDGALLLTAGVDVQADRLELEVVGWGYGAENWGVQYAILPGDPNKGAVWQDLDAYLQRTFRRSDGAVLPIACTCIDSGYATSEVYHFCRTRGSRYIFAIKGQGGPGQPEVGAYRKQGKNKDCPVFPVGSDSGKDMFISRLGAEHEGAGYCHWPREELFGDGSLRGYTEEYFKGLSSEKRVPRKSQGRLYHTWVKKTSHARNEALDCRVYASAALRILNPNWEQLANRKRPAQVQPGATKTATSGRRVLSRGVQV